MNPTTPFPPHSASTGNTVTLSANYLCLTMVRRLLKPQAVFQFPVAGVPSAQRVKESELIHIENLLGWKDPHPIRGIQSKCIGNEPNVQSSLVGLARHRPIGPGSLKPDADVVVSCAITNSVNRISRESHDLTGFKVCTLCRRRGDYNYFDFCIDSDQTMCSDCTRS